MQTLRPFNPISNLEVSAEMATQTNKIYFEFLINKGLESIRWPQPNPNSLSVPFKDELWKTTCFEAFLRPKGQDGYFEFNFSSEPAWACYQFKGYRHPTPPQSCPFFSILNFTAPKNGHLKIELENNSGFKDFYVGLTAVIEQINGAKHYFAINHLDSKPNFHILESFSLERK